jgi:hypothetical protein
VIYAMVLVFVRVSVPAPSGMSIELGKQSVFLGINSPVNMQIVPVANSEIGRTHVGGRYTCEWKTGYLLACHAMMKPRE